MYLDDVIIFGENLQEHHERIRIIFEGLRQFNLKIEPDKCEFFIDGVKLPRTCRDQKRDKTDPQKDKVINDFPTPRNATDAKSILGLAGYYRKFILQFSKIVKPLNEVLKNAKWRLEEEHTESFHLL